ncbi:hypothetical protein AB1N83_004368 [Pleurotus pulmonarius]
MWIGRSSGRRGRPTESYPLLICNPATMVEAKQGCYGGHRVICLGLMFGATTVTAHHLRESRLLVRTIREFLRYDNTCTICDINRVRLSAGFERLWNGSRSKLIAFYNDFNA